MFDLFLRVTTGSVSSLLALSFLSVSAMADALPGEVDDSRFPIWVEQMKSAARGPFERIRWFCADGAVLPPQEGACREHGGGVQHGEWNSRTLTLRSEGYLVANLLSDLKPADFSGEAPRLDELRQVLLEQFLVANDDGWVFRQARYYRGALQAEDEQVGARRLIMGLAADEAWRDPTRFLLLREAVRLLPVRNEPAVGDQVRTLAIDIAEADPGFTPLRVRIHGMPDARNPQLVRDYAKNEGLPALAEDYARLASLLDALNAPQTAVIQIEGLARDTRDAELKRELQAAIARLRAAGSLDARLQAAAQLSGEWRRRLEASPSLTALNRFRLLIGSLAIEQEVYAVGNQLVEQGAAASRATRLGWLRSLAEALYGSGLLSARQRQAIAQRIDDLTQGEAPKAADYDAALRYLARVPQWAQRAMEFQFGPTVQRWSLLTPLVHQFVPDRLRGGPLLAYTRVLDGLVQDSNALVGIRHQVFGHEAGSGLRALNPGLRRGVLLRPPVDGAFRRDGIYLLPSTTPELPPVAGILTLGEGSSLSHVQLLARNLGIPNVVVDDSRIAEITPYLGRAVVLAVSPRGAVRIAEDGPAWDAVFGRETLAEDLLIAPDLAKLELDKTDLLRLRDVSASDSGRTVGPKAANLGELRRFYPEAVNPGVAIPFGVFRELLDRPIEAGGPAAFEWMQAQYARIRGIGEETARQQEVERFLARLRQWITGTDPGEAFRDRLRGIMQEVFGDAAGVGVFVRSDTNVEDLPGFTGAGLNMTVPNVIGFEAVVQAVQQVWASPFTERAYAWRQAHMRQPEHVYPAVLLLQTFDSEKSGVLVTVDVDTGDRQWLSIAAGEGVGGAVEGQAAEELRVRRDTGEVRLLAQASAATRAEPDPQGGIRKVPASGRDTVLTADEIERLRALADDVERRFPLSRANSEQAPPADIEFGFRDGRLALFQIRPFVESTRARRSAYLVEMDRADTGSGDNVVDLRARPQP